MKRHFPRTTPPFLFLRRSGIAATVSLLLSVSEPAEAINVQVPPMEISAIGDGWSVVAPDTARISFLIEGSGVSASDANRAVEKKLEGILGQLRALGDFEGKTKEERFLTGEQRSSRLTPGAQFTVQRLVGLTVSDLKLVPEVIDGVLKSGASAISDVRYLARGGEEEKNAAIKRATEQAKAQAEIAAEALGVSLGEVLSISIAEEPEGETLRLQQEEGGDTAELSDRESHWTVNVRFGVIRK